MAARTFIKEIFIFPSGKSKIIINDNKIFCFSSGLEIREVKLAARSIHEIIRFNKSELFHRQFPLLKPRAFIFRSSLKSGKGNLFCKSIAESIIRPVLCRVLAGILLQDFRVLQ
jgi:hypothetical protein